MAQAGGIASMGGLANQGLTTGAIPVQGGLQGTFGSTQLGQFGPPNTMLQGGPLQGTAVANPGAFLPPGQSLQGGPAQGTALQGSPLIGPSIYQPNFAGPTSGGTQAQPLQPPPTSQMNYQQLMARLGLQQHHYIPGPVQPNQSPLPSTIQSPGTALQDGSFSRPLPSAQPNFQTMVANGALPMGLGQQR